MPIGGWISDLPTRRADPVALGTARVLVGIAGVLRGIEAGRLLARLTEPGIVRVPYVEGLLYLSAGAVPAFTAAWLLAAALFAIGYQTRIAGLVLSGLAAYLLLLDEQAYSNNLYLLIILCLLLVIGQAGNALSADAHRHGRRRQAPYWPMLLLKLQLSIVYGFAALTKLNVGFLSGAAFLYYMRADRLALIPEGWQRPLLAATALGAVLTEGFLAIAFWMPSWRRAAAVVGVAFHAGLMVAMSDSLLLPVFTLEMLALYALFLVADGQARREVGSGARTSLADHAATDPPERAGSRDARVPIDGVVPAEID